MYKRLIAIAAIIVVAAISTYAISPLFIETTIDEAIPTNAIIKSEETSKETIPIKQDETMMSDEEKERMMMNERMMEEENEKRMMEEEKEKRMMMDERMMEEEKEKRMMMDERMMDEEKEKRMMMDERMMDEEKEKRMMMDERMMDEEKEKRMMMDERMMDEEKEKRMMMDERMVDEENEKRMMMDERMMDEEKEKRMMMDERMMEEEKEKMANKIPETIPMTYAGTIIGAGEVLHDASGNVRTIPLEDGSEILRLENFSSVNGPDLHVYLSTDKSATDFVNLGKLKANNGNQNYDIPENTDLDKYDTVLVWCKIGNALFGSAELSTQ